jgi:uncharacterized protein (DUF362 family)
MRPKVILRQCDVYDPIRIQRIVEEALDELGLRPFGRTLVKPNVVSSGPRFPHAYTRPEFVEGVLRALRSRAGEDLKELAVGERCGITMPTRFAFDQAGYYPMLDRVGGVEAHHFDEVQQVEIPLTHPGRLRDSLYTPKPVAQADFFVNCPKFKAHPWTTVTFSMKNYIGIQDDRHRLIDHDHTLDEKVADLQYIVQPQFIAIDAIVGGEGRMLTPVPRELGMILLGNNQVAIDAVGCRLIDVDPRGVAHVRMAHERGFGPIDLEEIELTGDLSLDAARERAKGFKTGLIRLEEYFAGTNVRAYSGSPVEGRDYCWGGCPGAMEEAIEILRQFDARTDEKLPPIHVVMGSYRGDIPAREGEKVVFIGDCASFQGKVGDRALDVASTYRSHAALDPRDAKETDIFVKMFQVEREMFKKRKDDLIFIRGCPVSVAEQVLLLAKLGRLRNPMHDRAQMRPFLHAYFSKKTKKAIRRIFGERYQQEGPAERGAARPAQNLPA